MAYAQEPYYFSISTPLGTDKLLLRSLRGEERVSGLFRFALEFESEDRAIDFTKIVGQRVTVAIDLEEEGSQRFVNGHVGRFVQAGSNERFATYHAEVFPWLWLLTFSVDCRIFQNLSVPAILEQVFSDHGQTDFRNELKATYAAREYCVQYNESAFDFVSRLMEDEGIYYFFEHQDGKHTLVLADDPSAFAACPGAGTVRYGTYDNWVQQNVLTACTLEQNVINDSYALDDFNFETPSTDLEAAVESTVALSGPAREIYAYPGGFLKKDVGEGRAKLRIEGREAGQKILRGDSYCRAFTSGHTFTLEGHYRDDANSTYALLSVYHSGSRQGYSNSFTAVASTLPYRPPVTTRKPTIPGTQTALVVGKSGEEIWTDKYGRVKVQFHWDREGKKDETSSCWIRVAHGWAGKGWGQIFLPRIGQEVVVSFLEGDPDRPLITGSVYNSEQAVPYTLPDDQTKSTVKSNTSKGGGGYNELRFEDKKDNEQIYFHAEKDFIREVENNDSLTVGSDQADDGSQ
ncbi:MAG: type VI secretion system tip protein VgrG, partial [Acidobacteria bacterium]|nr:type VI secretion system tip protein VgrG [Acidobacteriota bacterium]